MLGSLSAEEITRIVVDSIGSSPLPYLRDESVRERAARIARSQGFLERIEKDLTPEAPIPALLRSHFRDFRRTGGRSRYDPARGKRQMQIKLAAAACYFGIDRMEYLQDLLWAECEDTWWISPAHEHHSDLLDLRSTMSACEYATILAMLADRMEREVRDRVASEIRTRVLETFLDPRRQHYWWKTGSNNWNAVCHGGIAIAAMLLETDPDLLVPILLMVLRDLENFIDGFTDDGGCTEGPSYWRYGFGWYVKLAAALYDFTGGRIDIMEGEKIDRICRSPLSVTIKPGAELTFADAHSGYQSPATVIRINRFCDVPELFGLCRLHKDGTLAAGSLEELMLYDGSKYVPPALTEDTFLPDLGVALVRGVGVALGAKSGCNDEHHNHNDVGSFLVRRGETVFLCDPGGPIYTARTFGPQRYESVFCNSFGHSVPVVNGRLQSEGRKFAGTTAAEGLNGGAARKLTLEIAGAYDEPSLRRLTRVMELPADGSEVRIGDTFAFSADPKSVEEAFLTTLPCEASGDGRSVTIRSDGDGSATLAAADTDGTFMVTELTEESKAESSHGELLRRITFTPAALAREMTLSFVLRFGA